MSGDIMDMLKNIIGYILFGIAIVFLIAGGLVFLVIALPFLIGGGIIYLTIKYVYGYDDFHDISDVCKRDEKMNVPLIECDDYR